MGLCLRRARVVVLAVLVGSFFVSACSNQSGTAGAVGTTGNSQSILVAVSTRGVSVENHAGRPLREVQVAIQAAGSGPEYAKTIAELGTGERRDVPLAEFQTPDKTSINPMFVRPQRVVVKAHDDSGQNYNVTVPWK